MAPVLQPWETIMSQQERKQEQKSPAKLEIRRASGVLDDEDFDKVTGGVKGSAPLKRTQTSTETQ
jgi:hypothetical protein